MNWYLEALSKYATFHGRARRKEFWFFALFNFILNVVLLAIDIRWGQFSFTYNVGLFGGIYSLAVLLPGLAVAVRRLHDTNRSGWWLLIALIPLVGAIVLLVFMLEESQPGQNRYGVCPKRINSESPPPAQDSVSWMAIASLVCGVLTLTIFWLPILHLVPGLLAILLAVLGLAQRGEVVADPTPDWRWPELFVRSSECYRQSSSPLHGRHRHRWTKSNVSADAAADGEG